MLTASYLDFTGCHVVARIIAVLLERAFSAVMMVTLMIQWIGDEH